MLNNHNQLQNLAPFNPSGVDYAQLENNLELSYEQRLLKHQKALDLIIELQNMVTAEIFLQSMFVSF